VSGAFYRALVAASRVVGPWIVGFFAWWVAAGYFLFRPARRRESLRFYRALFPEASRLHLLGLAWRQFQRFAGLFADRLRLARGGPVESSEEGFQHLLESAGPGRGAVLLMSHLGSWEVAALLFRQKGLPLMLFMGAREREQVERQQKAALAAEGLRLVVTGEGGEAGPEAALGTLEGLSFLQQGGLVSMAGDRLWGAGQRAVEVCFLGHRVKLPAGPHLFALAAGVPLVTFFGLRLGRGRYHLVAFPPRRVEAQGRADRWAAVQRSAQEYADRLAEVARRYPAHWFHFEPFLGVPWQDAAGDSPLREGRSEEGG
jgi:predicted LPLAT superfamily acyltransferase